METRLTRLLILLATVGTLFSACKSGRELGGGAAVAERAIAAQPEFNSLDIKRMTVNVTTDNGTSYTSPATCRIIRDSVVHLSVQPIFGIEMFMAQLTRDRFVVLDKMRKVAYTGTYEQLGERMGLVINFNSLQALLTNRLFVLNTVDESLNRLKAETHKGMKTLQHTRIPVRQQFILNDAFRIQETQISAVVGNYHFTARYDGFTNQDLLVFPYQQTMSLEAGKKRYSLGLTITRMIINMNPLIPSVSLQGYRIGNIDQLLH
ncbi:MAG: DUF4292 domain-containing protein [Paludibacter sp.]|jgi:hypothetical protein|nr:DUF4292 domain-containing protein [Paludibacter sp.]